MEISDKHGRRKRIISSAITMRVLNVRLESSNAQLHQLAGEPRRPLARERARERLHLEHPLRVQLEFDGREGGARPESVSPRPAVGASVQKFETQLQMQTQIQIHSLRLPRTRTGRERLHQPSVRSSSQMRSSSRQI